MSLHQVNRMLTFCLVLLDLKLRATSKSQRVQHAVPELWHCLGPQRGLGKTAFPKPCVACAQFSNLRTEVAATKQIYKQLQIMMPRSMAEWNEPTHTEQNRAEQSKEEFPSGWGSELIVCSATLRFVASATLCSSASAVAITDWSLASCVVNFATHCRHCHPWVPFILACTAHYLTPYLCVR